eukprot:2526760-Pyramimonas_sp.AAC.1
MRRRTRCRRRPRDRLLAQELGPRPRGKVPKLENLISARCRYAPQPASPHPTPYTAPSWLPHGSLMAPPMAPSWPPQAPA